MAGRPGRGGLTGVGAAGRMINSYRALDRLAGCSDVLIAGAGAGFDIFCDLPIAVWSYDELMGRIRNFRGGLTTVKDW